MTISIKKLHAPTHVEEEFVVVIDVLRTFTTAAYALSCGAEKIILVSTAAEAFALRDANPAYLLMGEENVRHIEGFDFGNSPVEISHGDIYGKTLVHRTSAGTQGVTRSLKSKKILTSSFVIANATIQRIKDLHPSTITFVITGTTDGDEDRALADYLEELLISSAADPAPYLQRVSDSPEGVFFRDPDVDFLPAHDLDAALMIDLFPFSTEIFIEEGLPVLRATNYDGTLWKKS